NLPYTPPAGATVASGLQIGQLAVAPDAGHVAFSAGYAYPDQYDIYGPVYVASLASGDAVEVPNATADVGNRPYAWIASTKLAVATDTGIVSFDTGTTQTKPLPNLPKIDAANGIFVVDMRVGGAALWFDILTQNSGLGSTILYHYDLSQAKIVG